MPALVRANTLPTHSPVSIVTTSKSSADQEASQRFATAEISLRAVTMQQ
jgi:hypothetical protein